MRQPRRWSPCVDHRGAETLAFLDHYLADPTRRCLLIAGAGFDPRGTVAANALAARLGDRLSALLIQEVRREPSPMLADAATKNVERLRALVPLSALSPVEILAEDNAVIGGRQVVELLRRQAYAGITDLFIDMTSLSIGTSFPVVRYYLDLAEGSAAPNVHALVVSSPGKEERRVGTSNDIVTIVHGFAGRMRLHSAAAHRSRLWMPQLSMSKSSALDRIWATERFDDVCPILPFPAAEPRAADRVARAFSEQLERPWEVDARNLVYAAEADPVDVYRTILDIEEERRAVFGDGSEVILSPVGSKPVALGALMAAIEAELTVVYVETLAYDAPAKELEPSAELLHVWLHGEAYPPRVARRQT